MRIALLTKRFPPACCGVGDYTAGLAQAMSARGMTSVVLTATEKATGPTGVKVDTVPLRGWRDLRGLLRRIHEEKVDAVQLEYSGYGWGRQGFAFWVNGLVAALSWSRVPVTVALHEFPLYFLQHPLQSPVIVVQWLHIWLLAACANRVFTNTEPRVKLLQRLLPWSQKRIQYRPNSSTIPVTAITSKQREAIRTEHGAGSETLVLACFGMFGAGKNYEVFLQAAAAARKRYPIEVWLLGNWEAARPAYIEGLRTLIRELGMEKAVRWSGYLPPKEVSARLQACDLFVLPQPDGHLTRSSAFMAAAAHGLPVIAVCNKPYQSEFRHGRNVWFVAASEPRMLSEAIAALGTHPQLRCSLGKKLASLYMRLFDLRHAAAAALPEEYTVQTGFAAVGRSRGRPAGERSKNV